MRFGMSECSIYDIVTMISSISLNVLCVIIKMSDVCPNALHKLLLNWEVLHVSVLYIWYY